MNLKKLVKGSLLALSGVLAVLGVVVGIFVWVFVPFIPDPDFPVPENRAEAYLQDLDYLRSFPDYDRSFIDGSRDRFQEILDDLAGRVEELNPGQFELGVARAVAQARNAHSNVSPIGRRRRVNGLPLRLARFTEGYFVLQTTKGHIDLLGARVDTISGLPAEMVAEKFIPFFGGHEGRSRFFSSLNMESPELLHALGISEEPDRVDIAFTLPDGKTATRTLESIPAFEKGIPILYGREVLEYSLPEAIEGQWNALMAGETPPLYLGAPGDPYVFRNLDEENGVYVKINFNMDVDDWSLAGFLDETMEKIAAARPQMAIVDLRFNGGGTDTTNQFARRLPQLLPPEGRIYIVTSAQTFSAGLGAVAMLKIHGGDRAIIVGEPVGDHLRFWANGGEQFRLPNSRIAMYAWSAREDWQDGCRDLLRCFWLSKTFFGPTVKSLDPDLPVSFSFEEYRAGRDPAFEAILSDRNPA